MKMSKFLVAAFAVLLLVKLVSPATISWLWVFAPLWMPAAAAACFIVFVCTLMLMAMLASVVAAVLD
jgi:hypothetical protein